MEAEIIQRGIVHKDGKVLIGNGPDYLHTRVIVEIVTTED